MLKEVRIKMGMSQSQLSSKSGVNLKTLQKYEQGDRNINGANLSTLADLSIALECSISELLTDEDLIEKISKCKF